MGKMDVKNLEYLLNETEIGQADMARLLGISKDKVYNYLSGRSAIPLEIIKKIVDLVGNITVDEFRNKDLSKLKRKMIVVIKSDAATDDKAKLITALNAIIEEQKARIALLEKQVEKKSVTKS